ncbi:hypothetical protein BKA00_004248 [Actinomadura coerulea]|uniref:Uncharacterized protein n=1 Tax=Actinomadura coerulea TaxID=46159 RepID=A0A7X0G171_9ACTN|nr:hypothetical protein [Actinomadura coerulea]MBB6397334.1 hypothetical protein [Actinomadura coerulea]GGQ01992.1 hypothetical protein GCM10010187_17010 [Actinomadura coerulea]
MYHHEIMQSLMSERTRALRAQAAAERDARLVRRAREYWAERAERIAARPASRRHRHRDAAPAR